jgi:hypothetical protein
MSGKHWTTTEIRQALEKAHQGWTNAAIGTDHNRSEKSVETLFRRIDFRRADIRRSDSRLLRAAKWKLYYEIRAAKKERSTAPLYKTSIKDKEAFLTHK